MTCFFVLMARHLPCSPERGGHTARSDKMFQGLNGSGGSLVVVELENGCGCPWADPSASMRCFISFTAAAESAFPEGWSWSAATRFELRQRRRKVRACIMI